MKKYILIVASLLCLYSIYDYIWFYNGKIYIKQTNIETFSSVYENDLMIKNNENFEEFEIKGVNIGLGKPGMFKKDYAITKTEYLMWFDEIKELGANVIRVNDMMHSDFYDAFYEFNYQNDAPLYLIQGVYADEYMIKSKKSALDQEFYEDIVKKAENVIDIVNGRYKSREFDTKPTQIYQKDISKWVYGYIVGVDWEADFVAYTNNTEIKLNDFKGRYMQTENASNFEIFLANLCEEMIRYESEKYGTQRVIGISNWTATCPVVMSGDVATFFSKYAKIDTENIKTTEEFQAGLFVSYHVYPYYPEYKSFENEKSENTYLSYISRLNEHHEMPVLIGEFGVSTSRGKASYEENADLGRNQGEMTEKEQGEAIISMYEDIMNAGSAGGVLYSWQDEWYKRSWNTMENVDLKNGAFWNDVQTNEQSFGLKAFDVGRENIYIDGKKNEWNDEDIIGISEDFTISKKQNSNFLYLMIEKEFFDFEEKTVYIPIDITPKSGSKNSENLGISMMSEADFIIEIGEESRVWVHERYDKILALYADEYFPNTKSFVNPVVKDSNTFNKIEMFLNEFEFFNENSQISLGEFQFWNEEHYYVQEKYETGKLIKGNTNPTAENTNSYADYFYEEGVLEIRIPWNLINIGDPVEMRAHDDYYEVFGVEFIDVSGMKIGVGEGETEILMFDVKLEKEGRKIIYSERLKESYYILKEYWNERSN